MFYGFSRTSDGVREGVGVAPVSAASPPLGVPVLAARKMVPLLDVAEGLGRRERDHGERGSGAKSSLSQMIDS